MNRNDPLRFAITAERKVSYTLPGTATSAYFPHAAQLPLRAYSIRISTVCVSDGRYLLDAASTAKGMARMIIAICDDQKNELENIRQIVSEYAVTHPEQYITISCFSDPLDMLNDISKNGAPDIALLDICMPGVLGTEIAKELRCKSEENTDIIFLTTSTDLAVEAFALHVNDYLTKPFTKERLTDTLDRVVEKRNERLFVTVTSGREIHRIDLYQVMYLESKNHNVDIYLKSGKNIKTHTPLADMKSLFSDLKGFISVGASYFVNLRCVQSILQTELIMTNGQSIPIPRRLRNDLREQYFDFYREEAMKE